MEEKKEVKTGGQISILSIVAAVAAGFVSALFSLPNTGLASMLPVVVITSALAALVCKEKWIIYIAAGGMAAFFNSVYGYGNVRAVVFFFVYAAVSFLSVLAVKAVKTVVYSRKSGDKSREKKAVLTAVLSVLAALVIFCVFSGNLFSGLVNKKKNVDYVKENHENVSTSYTFYDFESAKYLTCIGFSQAEKAKNYYVSAPSRDDYYTFCTEKLSFEAKDYFEKSTTLSGETVECNIQADVKEISEDSTFENFKKDTSYVINMEERIVDFSGFRKVCEKYGRYFGMSDNFVYKSIVINAPGVEDKNYSAEFAPDGSVTYSINSD